MIAINRSAAISSVENKAAPLTDAYRRPAEDPELTIDAALH